MTDHIRVSFTELEQSTMDLLIAKLSFAGFEGFEETGKDLYAYINEDKINDTDLLRITRELGLEFEKTTIPSTNWNQVWESNYPPIMIDDYCRIRAFFHEHSAVTKHEITITPKMSFGTGHHATTYLMIQMMRNIRFEDKTVFDFGTGTGILSILAEKEDAKEIIAIDNDEWSVENASENSKLNQCSRIRISHSEKIPDGIFDVILANINKNVILENLNELSAHVKLKGILLVSGLLENDGQEITEAFTGMGFHLEKRDSRLGWICLYFRKAQ